MIKAVRYIITLMFLSASVVQAQHYVGIRGGATAGKIRMKPLVEAEYLITYPTVGLSYKYYGTDKVLGGIQIDLNIVNKGYKILDKVKSDTSYQRTITAVEIPFMWQPHVNLFKGGARLFLNLGPYISYSISSKDKKVSEKNGVLWKRSYPYNSLVDNRLECGLVGGGGFSVAIKRFEVLAEFRYSFGFSDVLKNHTKYKGNPDSSPLDCMSVSVGVYYKLQGGKKIK